MQLSRDTAVFEKPYSVATERSYNTTNKCLELYYYTTKHPSHLRITAVSQDLEVSNVYQTQEATAGWYRLLVTLPSGQNRLVLTGTRMKDEDSGIVVDDILVQSCEIFGELRSLKEKRSNNLEGYFFSFRNFR